MTDEPNNLLDAIPHDPELDDVDPDNLTALLGDMRVAGQHDFADRLEALMAELREAGQRLPLPGLLTPADIPTADDMPELAPVEVEEPDAQYVTDREVDG